MCYQTLIFPPRKDERGIVISVDLGGSFTAIETQTPSAHDQARRARARYKIPILRQLDLPLSYNTVWLGSHRPAAALKEFAEHFFCLLQRSGFPLLGREETENYVRYLSLRGIIAKAAYTNRNGKEALAVVRITHRSPQIEAEIDRILKE